jgi:uncharacterized SAM-binding protein YcdF (DUF218 family)
MMLLYRLSKALITLVFLAWFMGFLAFLIEINSTGVAGRKEKADAIVVLTGSPERLYVGFSLLEEGLADKLYISGVGGGAELKNIYPESMQARLAAMKDHIILDNRSTDTETNAKETAAWINAEHIGKIRLVTSNYHLPRARVEFSRTVPGLGIIMHPVIGIDMPGEPPVLQRRVAYFLFKEYNKFLIAFLRAKTEKSLPIW